jgi:phenylalanyl-tRNA synthetase alpha chain
MDTLDKLKKLRTDALAEIKQAETVADLRNIESKYLGKKSDLNEVLRTLKDLPAEQKGQVGKSANSLRVELETVAAEKTAKLKYAETSAKLASETMDLTLPSLPAIPGNLHPITKERELIEDIFQRMGFTVHDPYLIDDEYHNFTSLNIPEGHPARDMWDTIRIDDNLVLITHTSSMQNRIISSSKPPIRAIVPGKCFRNEATDATHEHSFFQLEGVYVDKDIKLADMIGTLAEFLKQYFGHDIPLKIQPTFFPFVEPGLEVMMPRPKAGKQPNSVEFNPETTDWMEVIPCGPIHPYVLKEAGVDPAVYSGFAWGLGLERLIMIKKQIDDVRNFHSGRLDFINQF